MNKPKFKQLLQAKLVLLLHKKLIKPQESLKNLKAMQNFSDNGKTLAHKALKTILQTNKTTHQKLA